MHMLNLVTLFVVLPLSGVEFSVSAFTNPSAWRLEPEPQLTFLRHFADVLGRVMPFWYAAALLLLGVDTWMHRHGPAFGMLAGASAVWFLASLASFVFLVPLNTRVVQAAAGWQQIHHTWDRRHRVRVAALALGAILLLSAVVR